LNAKSEVVDGAMCYRGAGPMDAMAAQLRDAFTVYTYDRRGRGESADTAPYSAEREVEDPMHRVDERVADALATDEVSIGDYVLSGGEPAAMVLVDAVVRLLPGALGSETSAVFESFSESLLDHPQYTRPPEFRGMKVPDVLLSGNHAEIERWRKEAAIAKTRRKRPDLLKE